MVVSRSIERMGMQNVLLRDCWWDEVAREEVRFVEHDSPLLKGPPETAEDDLPNWVGQVTRQTPCKEKVQKNDGYYLVDT